MTLKLQLLDCVNTNVQSLIRNLNAMSFRWFMVVSSSVAAFMFMLCVTQETFAKEGLNYTMEGKTGNTLNSHRLIALAGQQGLDKQDKLVELLFQAYFTQVLQHMLSS